MTEKYQHFPAEFAPANLLVQDLEGKPFRVAIHKIPPYYFRNSPFILQALRA